MRAPRDGETHEKYGLAPNVSSYHSTIAVEHPEFHLDTNASPKNVLNHPLGVTLRNAWNIALPYFRSEERWRARALLGTLVALNLLLVWTTLLFTRWQGAFYDALQAKDWNAFLGSLLWWTVSASNGFTLGFAPILGIFVLVTVYELFARQALQIRWRQWTTQACQNAWLADHAFFRMGLVARGTDNPDQRIAEDVRLYVDNVLVLGLGAIRSVATIFMFLMLLWSLSKPIDVLGVAVPGQLVWFALMYAGLGTWVAHLIGRRLTPLHFEQQRAEADFRFSLMRFLENTEGVALHRGEQEQAHDFMRRFAAIASNWRLIMLATRRLTLFTTTYGQGILIIPFLLVAPSYFAGTLTLGAIFQASNAFAQVQTALSWIVTSYADLTTWLATVDRLAGFQQSVEKNRQGPRGPVVEFGEGKSLQISALSLSLPDGKCLLHNANLGVARGERVLIKGPTGAGKSILLRAIAGIWPFGEGHVQHGAGRHLFMPQRPYVPIGTLKQAICYPLSASGFADSEVVAVMQDVGLQQFEGRLNDADAWEKRLSGGELQRLLFARALLLKPDWLFLDEATSAMDSRMEARAHELLLERLPGVMMVSVAHRAQVADHHSRILHLQDGELQSVRAFGEGWDDTSASASDR